MEDQQSHQPFFSGKFPTTISTAALAFVAALIVIVIFAYVQMNTISREGQLGQLEGSDMTTQERLEILSKLSESSALPQPRSIREQKLEELSSTNQPRPPLGERLRVLQSL